METQLKNRERPHRLCHAGDLPENDRDALTGVPVRVTFRVSFGLSTAKKLADGGYRTKRTEGQKPFAWFGLAEKWRIHWQLRNQLYRLPASVPTFASAFARLRPLATVFRCLLPFPGSSAGWAENPALSARGSDAASGEPGSINPCDYSLLLRRRLSFASSMDSWRLHRYLPKIRQLSPPLTACDGSGDGP